jgi:hypothetical protein
MILLAELDIDQVLFPADWAVSSVLSAHSANKLDGWGGWRVDDVMPLMVCPKTTLAACTLSPSGGVCKCTRGIYAVCELCERVCRWGSSVSEGGWWMVVCCGLI